MSKRVYLKGPVESLAPVRDEDGVQVRGRVRRDSSVVCRPVSFARAAVE